MEREESRIELCGRVGSYPEISGDKGKFEFEALYKGEKNGFMAYLDKTGGISYGDRVCFEAAVRRPYGSSLPGNLNWAGHLAAKGIFFEAFGAAPRLVEKAGFPFSFASAMRGRLLDIFEKNFKDDSMGVLGGVVLGDKRKISSPLKTAFQNSGAMHLLVASGSNVGFLMALFSFLFWKILKLGKIRSLLTAISLTGIYVLAAGLDPPLTRAYLMTFFAMLALIFQRKTDLFQVLIVSALAILLVSPRSLFAPGFQMSFAAVYGIVTGFACWEDSLKIKNKLFSYAVKLFFITVFAQLALFPLLVIYFHKFSLVSFFSNMALVPLSGLIMYSGFVLFVFEKLGFLFSFFLFLTDSVVSIFIKLVYSFGSLRYSYVHVPNLNFAGFASLAVLIFSLLHLPLFGLKNKKARLVPALALFLTAVSFFLPRKDFYSSFYEKGAAGGLGAFSGRLIAVNPSDAKFANSALYYGYERVDAVLITSREGFRPEAIRGMKEIMPVGPVYMPFWIGDDYEDLGAVKMWPGDSYGVSPVLKALWPQKKDGPGYSGLYREKLNYLVNGKTVIR